MWDIWVECRRSKFSDVRRFPDVRHPGGMAAEQLYPDGMAARSHYPDVTHPGGMLFGWNDSILSRYVAGCPPMVYSDTLSGYTPCMDSKELYSISDCFGDQKAIKTPKLNTLWLELIARVLNMLIGLKGNNYYSKVFKRVNYKLSNNTFWVVITG